MDTPRKTEVTARLPYVDAAWAEQLLGFCREERAALLDDLAASTAGPTQTDEALLAGYCLDIGRLAYALGEPLDTVAGSLREAATAFLAVFERRGTTAPLPVVRVQGSPGWQARFGDEARAVPASAATDDSLTNSRTGLLAMYLFLATGQTAQARKLAGLIGDPEGAAYLSPRSEVCTFADQQLAYALRGLLFNDEAEAQRQIALALESASTVVRLQAGAMAAFPPRDGQLLLGGLDRLLAHHKDQVQARTSNHDLEGFLCLPALALAAFAIDLGLLQRNDLPQDVLSFPAELSAPGENQEAEVQP